MTCGILQVIFGWLCQSTIIVSNNLEARPIHRINQKLGGNADPSRNKSIVVWLCQSMEM